MWRRWNSENFPLSFEIEFSFSLERNFQKCSHSENSISRKILKSWGRMSQFPGNKVKVSNLAFNIPRGCFRHLIHTWSEMSEKRGKLWICCKVIKGNGCFVCLAASFCCFRMKYIMFSTFAYSVWWMLRDGGLIYHIDNDNDKGLKVLSFSFCFSCLMRLAQFLITPASLWDFKAQNENIFSKSPRQTILQTFT